MHQNCVHIWLKLPLFDEGPDLDLVFAQSILTVTDLVPLRQSFVCPIFADETKLFACLQQIAVS